MLRPEDLERTAAIICLDIEQPVELMGQLKAWMSALSTSLFNLIERMETGQHERMKQKILKQVQTYEEPKLDENGKLIITRKEEHKQGGEDDDEDWLQSDEVKLDMPLGEGVLKVNLGIPIIVVCNKIDIILQNQEKGKLLQENLDFI